MSDIEQLIRGALAEDADSQPAPTDLVSVARRRGRQLRRLHRASVGALASAAAVAAVVVAISVVVPSGRNVLSDRNLPAAGNRGGASGLSSRQPTPLPTAAEETPVNWNEEWTTGRVFGTAASPAFLAKVAPGEQLTVYASGHAPDGSTFVMYTTPDQPGHSWWQQGFNSRTPEYGTDGDFSCDGQCNVFEYPTVQTYQGKATTQWLVVATKPGVSAVSFSPEGNSWQPMDFRDGIALLQLPGISPWSAEIHLTLSNGQTVESMLFPGSKPAPAGLWGPTGAAGSPASPAS